MNRKFWVNLVEYELFNENFTCKIVIYVITYNLIKFYKVKIIMINSFFSKGFTSNIAWETLVNLFFVFGIMSILSILT